MKLNKILLVSFILLTIISLGAVSAASDTTDDNTSVEATENLEISVSDDGEIANEGNTVKSDDSKLGITDDDSKLSLGSVTPNYTIEVTPNVMSGSNYVAQYGQIITVNGTFQNITGNVSIRFGFSGNYYDYEIPLVDGKFSKEITDYDRVRNNYQIQVKWAGNDYYKSISWSKNIHVQMNNVTANGANYGLTPYMDVDLFNATGNVTFNLNGRNYTKKLENGKTIQEFTNYTLGSNTVIMYYGGDDKIKPIEKSFTFNVDANIEAPTIYNYEKEIIKIYFGDATGKVNITFKNTNYTLNIVDGVATTEIENYTIGENTLNIIYSGDEKYNPFSTTKTFTVLDKEDAAIVSSVYKTATKNLIFINIPYATGTINVTVNGKKEVWELVNETVQHNINASDVITELIVSYGGNVRLNPTSSSFYVNLTDAVVNNKTFLNYFNQNNGGKLYDFIEDGITLDFQGSIINPDSENIVFIDINKPINVVSTTKDAYIDLNTTAGSLLGENPGNRFTVSNGGSGSNITGIYLHNTQLWISNTNYVVFNNISVVVEDQRVGSGVGATSVRDNSSYVTLKNSYFYTRNNGGSTTFTFSWATHCTFDNNTVKAEGNVGNLLYLNTFNVVGAPTGVPLNTYNKFTNNRVYGKEGSAISVGIMVEGAYNIIENNTCYKCSISTSFGASDPHNNSYIGNTMTDGSGLTAQANSIVYNNNATGALSTGTNSIVYNNTVGKVMTVGANAQAYNNTAYGLTVSGANAEAYENKVEGAVRISGAGVEVYDNELKGTITLSGANSKFYENKVVGTFTITGKNATVNSTEIIGDVSITSVNVTICGSNVSGSVSLSAAANECKIINNTINSTDDYAVELLSSGNVIIGNKVYASSFEGVDAIKSNDDSNKFEDNRPYSVNLTVSVADMLATQDSTVIKVALNESATGNVRVIVNGQIYTVKINKGQGNVSLSRQDYESGEYVVVAIYDGDEEFAYGQAIDSFNVLYYNSNINITLSDAKAGGDVLVNATLICSDQPAKIFNPTVNLQLFIDGEKVDVDFLKGSNIANYTIKNISAGKHSVRAVYSGENGIYASENITSFTIVKSISDIELNIGEKLIGKDVLVNITFGNVTGNISINFDGETKDVLLINGKGNYTIKNISDGTHIINAIFNGDYSNENAFASETFTLTKSNPTITISIDDLKLGEDVNVTVNVVNATGNVSLIIDGVETVVQLNNSVATYKIEKVTVGVHSVVANYLGDAKNNPVSTSLSKTLTVLSTEITDVSIDADLNINAVLKDSDGNFIKNATILYKIGIQNSTVRTNDNGTFNIKGEANSKVEISYAGSDLLLPSSTVISLGDENPVRSITEVTASDLTCYAVDTSAGETGSLYKFVLKDVDGNVISNASVKFVLNNVVYDVISDNDGVASIQVNIDVANIYTGVISYLGDDKHEAAVTTTKIIVNKKSTSLSASAKSFKAKVKTKKFTATLSTIKSADGIMHLSAGKTVTLKVNKKTFTAKTNSKGQVTFKITKLTKKGKYNAVISFVGDSIYNSAVKKVKITVKK